MKIFGAFYWFGRGNKSKIEITADDENNTVTSSYD
jgi:hypothetical protein